MSTHTTNYNLVKPEYTDAADIMDINGNMDIIDDVIKTVSDKANASETAIPTKQDITDNTLETTDKTVPGAINELNSAIGTLQSSLASGTYTATSLSALETYLLARCAEMADQEVRVFYVNPNFTSQNFFAGAIQVAIAIRRQSGVYRVAFPNICGDAYYYSGSWHYMKATMTSVTP